MFPCAGTSSDIDAINGKKGDEVNALLTSDGGSLLASREKITVVAFGSGMDAPIKVRPLSSKRTCWISHGDIDNMIDPTVE